MTYQKWRSLGHQGNVQPGQKRSPRSSLAIGATRIGVTVAEYMTRIEGGERWCSWHHTWEAVAGFTPVKGKVTGVAGGCRAGARDRERARIAAKKAAEAGL